MAKIRVIITFEYPVDMASYPDCETLEEVISIDKKNLEEYGDPELWGHSATKIEWTALTDD